jgi:DNA-directed RNA polymerase sigma subunit (sigma70/sigma32)
MNIVIQLAHKFDALKDVRTYVKDVISLSDNIGGDKDSAIVHLMQKDREQGLLLHKYSRSW